MFPVSLLRVSTMRARPFLGRLGIGSKIYATVGFLSVAAAAVGWIGLDGMRTYEAKVEAIRNASSRAVIGEQVNGLINAVVMDSRGVYMSRDKAEAEKFGKPLLANLKRIDERMQDWAALMPAARRGEMDAALKDTKQFIEFRT